jgi:hypothetical protein
LYITSFPIIDALWSKRVESFVVNLDPVSQIQDLIITDDKLMKTLVDSSGKFRKVTGNHSLTGKMTASNGYPVQCVKRMQPNPRTRPYLLEDWRLDTKYPILRYFSLGELERFAGLPTGWIQERGNSEIAKALKDSTNMFIAQFLMESFAVSQKRFSIGVYHG